MKGRRGGREGGREEGREGGKDSPDEKIEGTLDVYGLRSCKLKRSSFYSNHATKSEFLPPFPAALTHTHDIPLGLRQHSLLASLPPSLPPSLPRMNAG